MIECKVCHGKVRLIGEVDALRVCSDSDLYPLGRGGDVVVYYICESCKHIFTSFFDKADSAWWKKNIYNNEYYEIVDPDYKCIRPKKQAELLASALKSIKKSIHGLDWGGGEWHNSAFDARKGL